MHSWMLILHNHKLLLLSISSHNPFKFLTLNTFLAGEVTTGGARVGHSPNLNLKAVRLSSVC